jgi:hypothetical protein
VAKARGRLSRIEFPSIRWMRSAGTAISRRCG